MKIGIITIFLCIFFFLVPLHVYVMGNNLGIGIQGAVYRYQITEQGNSLIPFPNDLNYVISGTYKGKTAYSIISWIAGTTLLMILAIFSLIRYDRLTPDQIGKISIGVFGAGTAYLISCIFQYGFFFSGPAGISLPAGVIIMMVLAPGLYYYRDYFAEA